MGFILLFYPNLKYFSGSKLFFFSVLSNKLFIPQVLQGFLFMVQIQLSMPRLQHISWNFQVLGSFFIPWMLEMSLVENLKIEISI